ncbi:MAG: YesK family protein [Senegalia sp. (in: firmicutes)]|uniref:YesK family protein n=1 Tax=Senegalia sp. (in: firmicutes) TaxID=1924098 RepID=UPI003F9701B6
MDVLMLDGWTPIIILGIIFAIIMFIISFKVSKSILFLITIIISLFCIAIFIYSFGQVGGWGGLILGFYSIGAFFGTWIGGIIGLIKKLINKE